MIDDVLEGGAKAFTFETIGDTCKGRVVSATTKQQTDLTTGAPKTFADGSPMMQIIVTVEQEGGDECALYFKGGNFEVADGTGKSSLSALRDALAGTKLEVGGMLAMQYSGNGKKKNAGFNAPKLYTCQYKAPTPALAVDVDLI